jgi:CDP-diacylglycerol---glycerol-3-phosphate 3-phosphatidyltransferase
MSSLPNILTMFRIAVIPVLVALFYVGGAPGMWLACAAFVLAGVTDYLDGAIARARSQQSAFGRVLDPIADKLLVASTLLLLAGFNRIEGAEMIPAVIILCREIVVSGLREFLAELNVPLPVTQLAKWKTALQILAIAFLIAPNHVFPSLELHLIGIVGLWSAAGLTLVTGWDYARAAIGPIRTADATDRAAPGEARTHP